MKRSGQQKKKRMEKKRGIGFNAVAGMGGEAIVETRTMQTLRFTCKLDIRLIGVSGGAIVE